MQHHPGSWYIPWGVPLQKMLTVPFNAAAGYHQPQIAAAAVAQQQNPQSSAAAVAQQQVTAAAAAQPHTAQQTYQMHHSAAAAAAALQHHNAAMHQQQSMHPAAAAAAMFTPLTLRSFVPLHNHHMPQQPIPGATHQQHHQHQPQQHTTSMAGASPQPPPPAQLTALNINGVGVLPVRQHAQHTNITSGSLMMPMKKVNCMIFSFFDQTHSRTLYVLYITLSFRILYTPTHTHTLIDVYTSVYINFRTSTSGALMSRTLASFLLCIK